MRIIPAIDIIGGKCVRLSRGNYDTQKVYNENPLEVALQFQEHGLQYLHLVDLDGAKANTIQNIKVLANIASKTNLKIDFGGGIKTPLDLAMAFDHGASQVTMGSMAVRQPDIFTECLIRYGSDKIILGADCLNRKIATHGWIRESAIDVLDFVGEYVTKGISYVTCTDISKDGMMEGVASELYTEILSCYPVRLIASGGVSSFRDLRQLKSMGCDGVIIGKAIYEGRLTLNELRSIC